MSKFFGFGDGYYDPPDEPETTPAEDLANAVDALLNRCKLIAAADVNALAGLESFLIRIEEIRDEMKQADDAENTAQYEAEMALDKEMQEAFETNQARLHDDDGDWQERHDGPTSGEEF